MSEQPDEQEQHEAEEAEPEAEPLPADPDEPGPGTDEEPVPVPDEPEARSEKEIEAVWKKVEKSATTWRNALSRYLGEQANDLYTCPMCDERTPGYFGDDLIREPQNRMRERLFETLSVEPDAEYRKAQHASECGDCSGLGEVLSGSRVPNHVRIPCPGCRGVGFVTTRDFPAITLSASDNADVTLANGEQEQHAPVADAWGQPLITPDGKVNPSFGHPPAGVPG